MRTMTVNQTRVQVYPEADQLVAQGGYTTLISFLHDLDQTIVAGKTADFTSEGVTFHYRIASSTKLPSVRLLSELPFSF